MEIRKATQTDLPTIVRLIDEGRKKMVAQGNIHQWTEGHPSVVQLQTDISNGHSYLVESNGVPVATFALIPGPDHTYATIYDGCWHNDRPYYVIHRIASLPDVHGVMPVVLDFAFRLTDTIRIDTHQSNVAMLAILKKQSFLYCGIIHLDDGAPRMAFMKTVQAPTP